MSSEARTILENLHQPERLEQLYRENPVAFRQALKEALQHRPDSETLRVWHVRLTYRPERPGFWRHPALWKVLAIALGTALLVRLPLLWRAPDWYLPRFAPMWSLLALAAYFALGRSISRRLLLAGLVLTGLSALWVSLLPDETDTTVMALLHLPVLFWLYAGMVYLGGAWTLPENRCTFVRYSGALLITASLLALGGLVFSALTVGLFELVRPEAEEWYFQNIGLPGLAALPVVAAFAGELLRGRQEAFLELLARLFGPLFLAMISTFLVATLLGGKNPFLDRNFLIVFNGVLLLVLAMTVFPICCASVRAASNCRTTSMWRLWLIVAFDVGKDRMLSPGTCVEATATHQLVFQGGPTRQRETLAFKRPACQSTLRTRRNPMWLVR